jgi:HNH endonuclease
MSRYISESLRLQVFERAQFCCEYCKMPQAYSLFSFQVDHIISLKHGGTTIFENLALSCAFCNSSKGPDLGTFLENPDELIRFFNPRKDVWNEHFELENTLILPISQKGAATLKILAFNDVDRIMERQILINAGLFPNVEY